MRKFLFLLLTVAFSFSACAQQYKIVDRSSRRMPDWVTSLTKDYLNVTATAPTLEEAKAAALASVKQQIAESIASRIVAETDFSRTDVEVNDRYSYKQKMETSIKSRSAKLPFISEISLSKVSNFYWEKRYTKMTMTTEYFYAVQYPFSDFDMKKLVLEFNMHERELNEKLAAFESGMNAITSIEDIDKSINDLRAFSAEFLEEDPRFTQINSLSNQYRKLYDYISLNYVQEKKGVIAASLLLSDHQISTRQKPILKSNCASKLASKYEGNTLIITYDDTPCYDEDENYVEVRYRTGNKYLTEKIFFKNKVNISLNGIVTDIQTGEPIPYVKVTLLPSTKSAMTNKTGMYQFNDLAAGTYSIQALNAKYITKESSAEVVARGTARADIQMQKKDIPAETVPVVVPVTVDNAVVTTPPVASTPSQVRNGTTVPNGLTAYYKFNDNYESSTSSPLSGQPVNDPIFSTDSKDGSKSVEFSSSARSQIVFPYSLISMPNTNYSVSFWIKGFSNGHIFSSTDGSDNASSNVPRLVVQDNKFHLINRYQNEVRSFSHSNLSYDWHHIVVSTSSNNGSPVQSLYIDGKLADVISCIYNVSFTPTKFIIGGDALAETDFAIDFRMDNLRIYGNRALSADEVLEIYTSEQ